MQRSDVRQLLSNPEALQAMMQVQQGMNQLRQTAPGLFNQPGYVQYCVVADCALKLDGFKHGAILQYAWC